MNNEHVQIEIHPAYRGLAPAAAFASVNLHGEAGSEFTNLSASFNLQARNDL